VDYPGSVPSQNLVIDINNSGNVVGYYSFSDYAHLQGYSVVGGTMSALPSTGYNYAAVSGISDDNTIVGSVTTGSGSSGYTLKNGSYTYFNIPGVQ
jgi:hypothetical protein